MTVEIIEFAARRTAIDGLFVVTPKQISDERGTIRELFRRSAFDSLGMDLGVFDQINVTATRRGAVRGMHAEDMTKLLTVASGEAFGAYVDLRADSPSFGRLHTELLRPGLQVLVPAGVANGFQALIDDTQYVYCFDREWQPGMVGFSCTPLDPDLMIPWPIAIDVDDRRQISAKDLAAPTLSHLRAAADARSHETNASNESRDA
jgi:dTDP-4-dehydrorhamnose 3,5-epimerase